MYLNYTIVTNDLVLTKYQPNNGTGIPTGLNNSNESLKSLTLEIHRRFAVCVGEGGNRGREGEGERRERGRGREREREREKERER